MLKFATRVHINHLRAASNLARPRRIAAALVYCPGDNIAALNTLKRNFMQGSFLCTRIDLSNLDIPINKTDGDVTTPVELLDGKSINNEHNNSGENTSKQLQTLLQAWPNEHRLRINRLVRYLQNDPNILSEVAKHHIDEHHWLQYSNVYRRKLLKDPVGALGADPQLLIELVRHLTMQGDELADEFMPHVAATKQFILPIMLADAQQQLSGIIAANQLLTRSSDLRLPKDWYPRARIIKRKVFYHGGPTNSGKTYQALQRLKSADAEKGGGLYCGPLRLLALEVYESLNRKGVHCDLVTGQERREVPFGTHTSSTLEMINLSRVYDVAVIDEIQMIADPERGYAWTRALLGVCANEIHLCGGLEALEVVKQLLADTGDELEIKRYDRLGKLEVEAESMRGDYSKVRPGDCVVAFSRSDIFSIRRQIERLTPYKCSTIYGALPPETRSLQARMFNEGKTDILVASDAVGMGLNLNIGRVIFHTTIKKGEDAAYFVEPSQVKQIAGRAGRLSSKYKVGYVTAWQEADLAYIRAVMQWDVQALDRAGIFPSVQQIEIFSEQLRKMGEEDRAAAAVSVAEADADLDHDALKPTGTGKKSKKTQAAAFASTITAPTSPVNEKNIRLSAVLDRFTQASQLDGRFFLCDHENMNLVGNWLHTVPLTLADRFVFSNAPVSTRDQVSMHMLYQFAATYAQGRPVALNVRLAHRLPKDVEELGVLLTKHNVLDLYIWLSFRFPKYFVERELALSQKKHAVQNIQLSLEGSLVQAKYSHSADYIKTRTKLIARSVDGLPPASFGSVHHSTREILKAVAPDVLAVFPHLVEEMGDKDGPTSATKSTAASRAKQTSTRRRAGVGAG